jgi:hypothetical protein
MWLSDSRIPRRSTPTVMRPDAGPGVERAVQNLQFGLGRREPEKGERRRGGGERRSRGTSHEAAKGG